MSGPYLPDPANDETLTMSGYDWWHYRAAIEREAVAAFLASPEAAEELRVVFHNEYEANTSGDRYYGCRHINQWKTAASWDCVARRDEVLAAWQQERAK